MFFNLSPTVEQEWALWSLMGNLSYQGQPWDASQLSQFGMRGILYEASRGPDGQYPGYHIWANNEEAILALQGATPANGAAMSASAASAAVSSQTDWALACMWNGANWVYDSAIAQNTNIWRPKLTIVGHSYGGAVAIALMSFFRLQYDPDSIFCMTVGAPRPGYGALWNGIAPRRVRRYFAALDTVPRVLPRSDESPSLHAFLSQAVSTRLNRCVQGGSGMQLADDGGAIAADLPAQQSVDGLISISAWLTEQMREASPTHSWTKYKSIFDQRRVNFANPLERARVGSTPFEVMAPLVPVPPTVQAAVTAARVYVVNAARDQNSKASAVGSKLLMTISPSGGLFDVKWMGSTIATFSKRGYAARCVSKGNAWIRSFQRAIDIPSGAWEDVVREFLSLASDDPGPAVPPFKVSGPAV